MNFNHPINFLQTFCVTTYWLKELTWKFSEFCAKPFVRYKNVAVLLFSFFVFFLRSGILPISFFHPGSYSLQDKGPIFSFLFNSASVFFSASLSHILLAFSSLICRRTLLRCVRLMPYGIGRPSVVCNDGAPYSESWIIRLYFSTID